MVRLKLDGFDAFETQLRALPADLADQAAAIVHAAAERAHHAIAAAYPIRTDHRRHATPQTPRARGPRPRFTLRQARRPQTPPGALRAGMTVHEADRPLRPRSIVRNTNPLATIFENGTQARHTLLGANRGSMPPGHVFVPRAIQVRRAMESELAAMMRANDFVVTGA